MNASRESLRLTANQSLRHLVRSIFLVGVLLLCMAVLGALAGCGGGDPEDNPLEGDARKGFDPVPCQTQPEQCK